MTTAAWWGFVGPPAILPFFIGFPTRPFAAPTLLTFLPRL